MTIAQLPKAPDSSMACNEYGDTAKMHLAPAQDHTRTLLASSPTIIFDLASAA